jgi:hypothetical protein
MGMECRRNICPAKLGEVLFCCMTFTIKSPRRVLHPPADRRMTDLDYEASCFIRYWRCFYVFSRSFFNLPDTILQWSTGDENVRAGKSIPEFTVMSLEPRACYVAYGKRCILRALVVERTFFALWQTIVYGILSMQSLWVYVPDSKRRARIAFASIAP